VLLVVRRLALARELRRRLQIEERLRPLALDLLDEDELMPPLALAPEEAVVFVELLGRYGRRVRGDAAERVGAWLQGSGALGLTMGQLRSRRAWRRATAAYALGDMASSEAVPALLAVLDDADEDVRSATARSLGRLGAVEAVEPLLAAQANRRVSRIVVGQALLSIGRRRCQSSSRSHRRRTTASEQARSSWSA